MIYPLEEKMKNKKQNQKKSHDFLQDLEYTGSGPWCPEELSKQLDFIQH